MLQPQGPHPTDIGTPGAPSPKDRPENARPAGGRPGRPFFLALLTAIILPGAIIPPARAETRLRPLLREIREQVDADRAMQVVRRVYQTDRWFTFPKFQETAEYLQGRMKETGLDQAEIIAAPADGTSQFGFWTMPLAWDVRQASLEIVEPQVPEESRLLADYLTVPASLGMWSGPTPPGGVIAEVVELDKTAPGGLEALDVRGKLVLTHQNPSGIKWLLAKRGALGAINAFTENPDLQDGRQWINAWGDNGWAFIRGSTPLLCFSITPRQSAFLRGLLKEKGKVRVKATVDSRYYSGTYPYVTGILPGTGSGEEVLALGHTAEQGAQDNATGVAAMLEAADALHRLIQSGRLPRPSRAIRILAMGEMYGSMHYIATNPERVRRTVAAICLDTPAASYARAGTEYTFYLNPPVASSFVDALVLKIAGSYFPSLSPPRPWHWKRFMTGTDTYLGEPAIGIPTVWPYSGSGIHTHHNSEDTPDDVDPRSLRDLTVVTAAYLYLLASAGETDALWFAELAADRAYGRILEANTAYLEQALDASGGEDLERAQTGSKAMLDYVAGRQEQAVLSVVRLVAEEARNRLRSSLAPLLQGIRGFAEAQVERVRSAARRRSLVLGIRMPAANPAAGPVRRSSTESMVVKRKKFGTIPLDEISPDERKGFPSGAWALEPIEALYWCDGKRSLAEVIRLTQLGLGATDFDFEGYFRFLEERGYVEITAK